MLFWTNGEMGLKNWMRRGKTAHLQPVRPLHGATNLCCNIASLPHPASISLALDTVYQADSSRVLGFGWNLWQIALMRAIRVLAKILTLLCWTSILAHVRPCTLSEYLAHTISRQGIPPDIVRRRSNTVLYIGVGVTLAKIRKPKEHQSTASKQAHLGSK